MGLSSENVKSGLTIPCSVEWLKSAHQSFQLRLYHLQSKGNAQPFFWFIGAFEQLF